VDRDITGNSSIVEKRVYTNTGERGALGENENKKRGWEEKWKAKRKIGRETGCKEDTTDFYSDGMIYDRRGA